MYRIIIKIKHNIVNIHIKSLENIILTYKFDYNIDPNNTKYIVKNNTLYYKIINVKNIVSEINEFSKEIEFMKLPINRLI